MKQVLRVKSAAVMLALILILSAAFALFPQNARATGEIGLTANANVTELVEAGTITITGTITNNTGYDLTNVHIDDTTTGSAVATSVSGWNMEVGASASYSINLTLSNNRHYYAGSTSYWQVHLTAYGTGSNGTLYTSETKAVRVTQATAVASMQITVSSSNGGTPVAAGQTVTFTVLVQNTGNTELSEINVTDTTLGTLSDKFSLGVGESKTITVEHTMADTITVKPSATAKSVVGGVYGMQISAVADAITIEKAEAGLNISITPDTLDVSKGDTVNFTGNISNTGTMHITDISIVDMYGVEVVTGKELKAGESYDFTYSTQIESSDTYVVTINGMGADNEEIIREYELDLNVKLSEDDVRVDMTVTADYTELEEPDTVVLTFKFYNSRTEPIEYPMVVREVDDGTELFSMVILSPGTTTQDYEMKIEETSTLRFELVVTTPEGDELIAGAAACSITVQDSGTSTNKTNVDEKSNLGWLWTLLIVVVFLLVAAGVVFFVLVTQERKNKARRAAENGGPDQGDGYGYGGYDDYGDGGGYGSGDYGDSDGYDDASYDQSAYGGQPYDDRYGGDALGEDGYADGYGAAQQPQQPRYGGGLSDSLYGAWGQDPFNTNTDMYGGMQRTEFRNPQSALPAGKETPPVYQGQAYSNDDDFIDDLLSDDSLGSGWNKNSGARRQW